MDNKQKLLAAGAAILMTAGAIGAYLYTRGGKGEPEESKVDPEWEGFTDPEYKSNKFLSKVEAENRS